MFEKAKIRRNLGKIQERIEKLEKEIAFFPVKKAGGASLFTHLLGQAEHYHSLAIELDNPLDLANLKREAGYFLEEVRAEAGTLSKKHKMQAEFAALIVAIEALVDLM